MQRATFSNLKNNDGLFRLGIAVELLSYLSFIIVPLFLYRLLHHVHEFQAKLMVILVLVSITVSMAAVSYKINMLDLIEGASILSTND